VGRAGSPETPDGARAVVSKNIHAAQDGRQLAAIDEAAGDGAAVGVCILGDGQSQPGLMRDRRKEVAAGSKSTPWRKMNV
jgi:hypothetical protein